MDACAVELAKEAAQQLAKEAADRANEIAALQASFYFQDDNAPLTEQEQDETEAMRKEAISQVGGAIQIVRAQLAAIDSEVRYLLVAVVSPLSAEVCLKNSLNWSV